MSTPEAPGRPWADWKSGKPITPKALAGRLKPFGIFPHQLSVGDGKEPRGYARHALKNAFSCYLPPLQCVDVSEPPQPQAQVGPFQGVDEPSYRHIEKAQEMIGAVTRPTHRHVETAQRIGRENCRRKAAIHSAPAQPAIGSTTSSGTN
jgi:hypothetical protein